ncbi:MAG TPA: glycosyltransferase [Solirubrobacteraceae bacterium]|jgi:glycosyltransferase involved in cell wall biosynthesis|nr:glycosyltransferase [Solirubrobacteraceae bacterium]
MSLPAQAVCLDAQGAQSPHHHDRGIARYVVEHVRALHRARPEVLHSVLLNPTLPLTGNMDWLLGDDRLAWSTGDRRVVRRPTRSPAIYHVMSPFELQRTLEELWPVWARGFDVRTVVTLYDLIPLVFPEHYLRDPVIRTRYQTRAELVRRADQVLAISQTTAEDAIERLGVDPDRVSVIDAGATEKFSHMYDSPAAAWTVLGASLRSIRPGYMLYVAGFEFRKNLERLIAAYGLLTPELRSSHQLVIACRMLPSEAELLRTWAAQAGIDEQELVITGYVTDAELGALYHACTLFLFASIYEGSGLPILEAMSCGAPVVASNTSTASEILGDLEATFDPYEPAVIADCIAGVIDSPSTLKTLVERSHRRVAAYTWEGVAERSLQAYENLTKSRPSTGRRRRARIALVTPWPPERSGIADYNLRLARELGKTVDVDVVVSDSLKHYAPPQERGVRLVPSDSFRVAEALRHPDRVVYCMGNSSFHRHVYELLRERPGAVVAHDVRLTGFYGWFAGQERPEDAAGRLAERIEALYGPRLPAAVLDGPPPSWEQQAALGIYMTREIQQYAEEVFVHSRYALDVLELDRGTLDRQVPVAVLPFGVPETGTRIRSFRALGDAPLIVSVGVVSEVKGLADLITAVALVASDRKQLRLVIAGPGEKDELQRWRDFALSTAPDMNVEIPGHLSADHYVGLLSEADIAVQLRTLSNGEASAAVADCLAAGLPTVATDSGWASELPRDAISLVAPDSAPISLADRLEQLLGDEQAREDLSEGALEHARSCSFSRVAEAYLRALQLT